MYSGMIIISTRISPPAAVFCIRRSVPLPFGVTSVTRSSTVTCSRPFSLITSGQNGEWLQRCSFMEEPSNTRTHTRNNSTFAVCFQLILPPTLHQLCPEQFFQPAATHSVDIIQTSAVSKPFITKSPKRKACLPLPLPHFYQFLVYCRPHLRVFAHDLSETEHKQQRRRFGFNNFLGMYKKTFYLASYQVDVTFCRAGSAGGTHCPFTEPYRVKRKSLTVPLWRRLICLKPTTPLLKKTLVR